MNDLVYKIMDQSSSGIFFIQNYFYLIDDQMSHKNSPDYNPYVFYTQKGKEDDYEHSEIDETVQNNAPESLYLKLYQPVGLERVVAYKVGEE